MSTKTIQQEAARCRREAQECGRAAKVAGQRADGAAMFSLRGERRQWEEEARRLLAKAEALRLRAAELDAALLEEMAAA